MKCVMSREPPIADWSGRHPIHAVDAYYAAVVDYTQSKSKIRGQDPRFRGQDPRYHPPLDLSDFGFCPIAIGKTRSRRAAERGARLALQLNWQSINYYQNTIS